MVLPQTIWEVMKEEVKSKKVEEIEVESPLLQVSGDVITQR